MATASAQAPVLKDLTAYGHRARVELIEFRGRRAVRKTFNPGTERFLEREITIRERYGGRHPAITPLLHSGPLHLTYEYAPTALNLYQKPHGRFWPRRLLPLAAARAAFDALRFLHDEGYALLDFHPGNMLYTRSTGLKIIDFEFACRYPHAARPPFEQSWSIVGVPEGFEGDLPESWTWDRTPYEAKWRPYVAVDLQTLLHEPAAIQIPRRAFRQFRLAQHLHRKRLRAALATIPRRATTDP